MSSPRAHERSEMALVIIAALLVYGVSLSGHLFFGDVEFILHRRSFDQLPLLELAFGHGYWLRDVGGTEGHYYRPLVVILDGLCRAAFGREPLGYHAVNLGLHVMACLLVYRLGRALEVPASASRTAAQIFAVHPLVAHAVAYVSGHGDILMTLFALSAVLGALRYAAEGGRGALVASALGFGAALLCKGSALPMTVALPLIVAARGGGRRRSLAVGGSVAAVALGWFMLRAGAVDAAPLARGALYDPLATASWYVEQFLLPRDISFLPVYSVPESVFSLRVAAGALIFAGALVGLRRGDGATRVGILIAGAGFIPASGIVLLEYPVKGNYAYLPLAGVAVLVGLAFARLEARNTKMARTMTVLLVGGYGLLGFFTATTYHNEMSVVQSTLSAVAERPDSFWEGERMATVRTRYAIFSLRAAHNMARRGQRPAATALYGRALRFDGDGLTGREARFNLGHVLFEQELDNEARGHLEWAFESFPDRALPARDLGLMAARRGDAEEARRYAIEACARGDAGSCAKARPETP